jgi:lysophospholipase L1-like esterase
MSQLTKIAVMTAVTTAVAGAAVVLAPSAYAATTRYEAEAAPAVCGGTVASTHAGYSGSGFCDTANAVGSAVQFTVDIPAAGAVTLDIRYSNGSTANRPAGLSVNGAVVQSGLAFETTGAWTTWATRTHTVQLAAGVNTIRLAATTAGGLANLDYLDVATTGDPADPPGRPPECTGSSPIRCHFAVSPGNYTVTAWIGDQATAGNTSLSVEARRRLLAPVATTAGTFSRHVFTINVRQPEGQPTGQGGTGTPGLDLTFAGPAPKLSGLTITPASSPLVVYLAGDSTVCDQPSAPYTGWGQILPSRVSAGAVIANYGDSGEGSGSFLSNTALFPAMRPLIKSNDLVLIQFGHNDKSTSAPAFRTNLTTMINQVRARGGVPVLVTPPVRRLFSGSQLTSTALHVNGVGVNLPAEIHTVGSSLSVPVIDLTAKSEQLVESLGPADSAQLFLRESVDGVADNTHFSEYGAEQMANLVVQGIRERNLSLAGYLR